MTSKKPFGAAALSFLAELKSHNDRDWFAAHKAQYEAEVRDPFLQALAEIEPGLRRISAHFVVDARPVGGSMARIHRDTRFARDKSPYRTSLFARFEHDAATAAAAPALFLRIEPGDSAVGGGLWQPAAATVKRIRDAIVADPAAWQRACRGGTVGRTCSMQGESLRRVPPGYDPAHPCAEDLRRKEFGMRIELGDAEIAGPGWKAAVESGLRNVAPFVKFLCAAVELPF